MGSTWDVDHYEPSKGIAFTVISRELVSRLNITLARTVSGGTKITWQRMNTGQNDEGNAKADSWNKRRHARSKAGMAGLEAYATGGVRW